MSSSERILLWGLVALTLLHALAFWIWPGALWGASHLAVWPPVIPFAWLLLSLLVLFLIPRLRLPEHRLRFPGRREALLLALLAAGIFWLMRESNHFFGDGYHIIRSRGMSVTFLRAPVLVRATVVIVRAAEERLGIRTADGMALLSVLAGAIAVFLLLRISAALSRDDGKRSLIAAFLLTAGAMQLFFGHVEYYAILVLPVLVYLLLMIHVVQGRLAGWLTWVAYPLLLTVHLSALGLAFAQLALGWRAWRKGERWRSAGALALGSAMAVGLLQLARSGAQSLAGQAASGLWGYVEPYFNAESTRHAFGFLDPVHALAVFNDLLLVAPLSLAAIPVCWKIRSASRENNSLFMLGLAAFGCLAVNVFFNREIGPYRDWDTLAPYAFVYLAWVGVAVTQAEQRPRPALVVLVALAGLLHLLPWTILNRMPGAAEKHLRLVLQQESMWSPYARGYLHEEFAVSLREQGDLAGSFREYLAASQATPTDARYRLGLGDAAYRLGDVERALQEYREALRWRPDYFPAHNNLAAILAYSGRDLELARRHAQAALRIEPRNPVAWLTSADVAKALGNWLEARRAYEEALRLQPGSAAAIRGLESLHGLEARPQETP